MLRILRGGQRWLIWFVVIGIGGVFVFFLGLQGPLQVTGGGTLVRVGDHQFGTRLPGLPHHGAQAFDHRGTGLSTGDRTQLGGSDSDYARHGGL